MRSVRLCATCIKVLVMISVSVLVTAGAQTVIDAEALRARALEVFSPLPQKMPGSENDTGELIRLGTLLYFDKDLSADGKTSCNSCHAVSSGGSYAQTTAPIKRTKRDSPTVLNVGLHFAQFWDGRSPDLEAQAKEPMLNPEEMAMSSEAELLKRLRESYSYRLWFGRAFPGIHDVITISNASRAIAAFERTLITEDRFDDFLKGRDRALSRAERKGLELFLDNGCQKCHDGPGLGGNSFQKIGVTHPYANTNDLGRFHITGDEIDRYRFKVPPLRNVALTPPYFHDGKIESLPEAVRMMAYLQLDKELSDVEIEYVVEFLSSLSDKHRVMQPDITPALLKAR